MKLRLFILNLKYRRVCPKCGNKLKITNYLEDYNVLVYECKGCKSILETRL